MDATQSSCRQCDDTALRRVALRLIWQLHSAGRGLAGKAAMRFWGTREDEMETA